METIYFKLKPTSSFKRRRKLFKQLESFNKLEPLYPFSNDKEIKLLFKLDVDDSLTRDAMNFLSENDIVDYAGRDTKKHK